MRSYISVYVHFIWATKNRESLLHKGLRPALRQHLTEYAEKHNIETIAVNGVEDHVHYLCRMPPHIALQEIPKLLKGEQGKRIIKRWQIGAVFRDKSHSMRPFYV